MSVERLGMIQQAAGISSTPYQFANFIRRHADAYQDYQLYLAAVLASHAVETGHVCANLLEIHREGNGIYPRYDADRLRRADRAGIALPTVVLPPLEEWLIHLRTDPACRTVICSPEEANDFPKPLVLDAEGRLYLHRYHAFETELADRLLTMATSEPLLMPGTGADIGPLLATLFPESDAPGWDFNWPKLAAFAALRRQITIISGGPGTGKTTVVVRLLAALSQLCSTKEPLRILLAAPTGKAAARLGDAVESGSREIDGVDVSHLNLETFTLHRMLGYRRDSIHFRHDRSNPLEADLVIVDEASMVPLPMMNRIVDAVPTGARLILLGDMHQLASVESGYVLGDVCAAAPPRCFSTVFRQAFMDSSCGDKDRIAAAEDEFVSALSDCCVRLTYSWRFPPGSEIDRVSRAVNEGKPGGDPLAIAKELPWLSAPGILAPGDDDAATATVCWKAVPNSLRTDRRAPNELLRRDDCLLLRYQPFLQATEPLRALDAFESFRVLCATQDGPHGVRELNALIEETLSRPPSGLSKNELTRLSGIRESELESRAGFYDHKPILITENNYGLELFNGDVGVILHSAESDSEERRPLMAYFPPTEKGGPARAYLPILLPAHETAFAMTVHKSQGSQFPDVLVVLPTIPSPVLTRELVYTAVTRASSRVELWLSPPIFHGAVARRITRSSGLSGKLS